MSGEGTAGRGRTRARSSGRSATPRGSAGRSAAPDDAAPAASWRASWLWGAGAWLLLRVVSAGAAWFSAARIPGGTTVPVPGYTPPIPEGLAFLTGAWLRADALWYLRIAAEGYGPDPRTYAFLPAFPMATRVLIPVTGGNELVAGLLAAGIAGLVGLVALHRLVCVLAGGAAARAAVVALAVFPTAFFLVAPYGEPVLLLAAAGALLAAARGRAFVGAVLAAVAALSRPFGVLLAVPLTAVAWHGRQPGIRGAGAVAAPALGAAAGAAGWVVWVGTRLGDPAGALGVQSLWQREPGWPWATPVDAATAWWRWRATDLGPYFLLDLVALAAAVALVAATAVVLRRAGTPRLVAGGIVAYVTLGIVVPLATPFPPRPLLSFPRFVLALFPAFAGAALVPRRLRIPAAAASAAGLAWATAMFVAARPIF